MQVIFTQLALFTHFKPHKIDIGKINTMEDVMNGMIGGMNWRISGMNDKKRLADHSILKAMQGQRRIFFDLNYLNLFISGYLRPVIPSGGFQ